MGVPKVGASLNIKGVTAYQDSEDPNTWWYLPTQVPVSLGETLLTFNITYWGISAPHFSNGPYPEETCGAIVSGQSMVDMTDGQREALLIELKENWGIAKPKIKPVDIKNVAEVQLTLATNTLKVTDKVLPSRIQIGTQFSWTVGANNSLFAEFVAGANHNYADAIQANPSFGFNIVAEVEMQGDPWVVKVQANLDQTWRYIRNKFSAQASWGSANLGISVDALMEDLQVNGAVTIEFIEGSLDNEKYGNQLFEIGKNVFEQLNTQLLAKDGLFKLEPNPTPPEIREPDAPSWLPKFNLAYNAQIFSKSQSINYSTTLTYTGRIIKQLPFNVILAVNPSKSVEKFFTDMDDSKQHFITAAKAKSFQARMQSKANECKASAKEYEQALLNGRIDLATYAVLMNRLQGITSTSYASAQLPNDIALEIANSIATKRMIVTESALKVYQKLDKATLRAFFMQLECANEVQETNNLTLAYPVDDQKTLITRFVKHTSRKDWIIEGIETAFSQHALNEDQRDLILSGFKEEVGVIIPGSNFATISASASSHFPYSLYGKLQMTFPNGEVYIGTAWQYSATVLVTCAHNLYDADDGGKAVEVKYYPHFTTGSSTKINCTRWFYPPQYESNRHKFVIQESSKDGITLKSKRAVELSPTDVVYDYGVVILSTSVATPKPLNLPDNSTNIVGKVKAIGYRKYSNFTMEESEGALIDIGRQHILHGCSTEKGFSGCAITGLDSEGIRYALGIHCGGGEAINTNIARRMDDEVVAQIDRWSRNSLTSQESFVKA